MLCPKCGKESHNVRVCAHCQTPYPTDGTDSRGASQNVLGGASWKRGDPRHVFGRLPRAHRWGIIGLLAVVTVGYYLVTRERVIPVGVVVPDLIAAAMSPGEAVSTLRTVNATAQVEVRNGEVTVRVSAATFPQQRDGQLALAQQYARADAIVEGRSRVIDFLDPYGNRFARSDPGKGVVMTR